MLLMAFVTSVLRSTFLDPMSRRQTVVTNMLGLDHFILFLQGEVLEDGTVVGSMSWYGTNWTWITWLR